VEGHATALMIYVNNADLFEFVIGTIAVSDEFGDQE
jgi:hypothetical protein